MSYLAEVKKQIKETLDEAQKFVWEDVEKALKQSYRNGYEAGKAEAQGAGDAKDKSEKPRRRWSRPRSEATEPGEEARHDGD